MSEMKEYNVEFTITNWGSICVEATSEEEAEKKVQELNEKNIQELHNNSNSSGEVEITAIHE